MRHLQIHHPMFKLEDILLKVAAAFTGLGAFLKLLQLQAIHTDDIVKAVVAGVTALFVGGCTMLGGLIIKYAWKQVAAFRKSREGWKLWKKKQIPIMRNIKFGRKQLKNPTPAGVASILDVIAALSAAISVYVSAADKSIVGLRATGITTFVCGLLTVVCIVLKPYFGVKIGSTSVPIKDVTAVEENPSPKP